MYHKDVWDPTLGVANWCPSDLFCLQIAIMSDCIIISAEMFSCHLQVIGTPQRPTVSNAILVNSPHTPSSQFLTQTQQSDASPWSSG